MDGPEIDFENLERRFGLRRLDPDNRADAERLSRAQAIFEKAFGRKATMLTDHFPVLLNEEVLYLPDVFVGSLGALRNGNRSTSIYSAPPTGWKTGSGRTSRATGAISTPGTISNQTNPWINFTALPFIGRCRTRGSCVF